MGPSRSGPGPDGFSRAVVFEEGDQPRRVSRGEIRPLVMTDSQGRPIIRQIKIKRFHDNLSFSIVQNALRLSLGGLLRPEVVVL